MEATAEALAIRIAELYREYEDMRTMVGMDSESVKIAGRALAHLGKARSELYKLYKRYDN